VRMFSGKYGQRDFENSFVMRSCRKWIPVTRDFDGENFMAKIDNRWMFTPLALVLILIDVMDLVFAVDSIPAVFAITRDGFIVYTSNVCAILGLRSLYFLLANLVDRFIYLKTGLAIILGFVGSKMIVADYFPIPTWASLGVIIVVLAITIIASMIATQCRSRAAARK
jgi:tellurite resistance protein TerC